MKICQVSPGLLPISDRYVDASNEVIRSLSDRLVSLGNDVDIISLKDMDRYDSEKVTVHEVEIPGAFKNSPFLRQAYYSLRMKKILPGLMRQNKYDVVHFHGPASALFGTMGIKKYRIPTVYTDHNPNLGYDLPAKSRSKIGLARELNASSLPLLNSVCSIYSEGFAYGSVDRIIAVSGILKNNIIKYFHVDPRKIECIPNGVDTGRFSPSIASDGLKRKYGLEGHRIVLCVARIAPYKNQLSLVRSIKALVKDNDRLKFVFVGPISPPHIEYYRSIVDYVEANGMGKHVIFTGAVKAELLPEYYSIADIFILPSISEGLPLALLEAMSSGKPIIASSIPQNLDVAKNHDEILFVDPADSAGISEKISAILADKQLELNLSRNSRRTAVEYFDWLNIARRTSALYKDISPPSDGDIGFS